MLRSLLLFTAALVATLTAAAAPKVSADIFMNDGTKYKSATLSKLPGGWDKEIKAVADGEKLKISAEDIDIIVLWNDYNPEDKCVISWLPFGDYNKDKGTLIQAMKKDKPIKKWFALRDKGDNMTLWVSFTKLKPGKKKFVLEVSTNSSPYFLEKKDSAFLVYVPKNPFKPALTRTWLSSFLADDELIQKELSEEKELNRNLLQQQSLDSPEVFERLTQSYTPGRKL